MINSGSESSRLPQRGAPLIRPKLFPLPKHPASPSPTQQGRGLLSPGAKLWMGSGCPRSRRERGDKQEQGSHRALGLALHPSHAASTATLCSGHGHRPLPTQGSTGRTIHQKPQGHAAGMSHPCRVWAQNQLLQTQGPTHKPWGDAGDAPAAPVLNFYGRSSPLPPARSPGCTRCNSALLAAFVGEGVLKGKSLWGRERDRGIASPFLFMPARLHAAYRRHSIPRRANYRKERSQSQIWAVLHLIFLIQSHRLGKALPLRGRYKAGSQRESSASGRAGTAPAELWGFPSQGGKKGAAGGGGPLPASTSTMLLSGFYFNLTNILPRNQTARRKIWYEALTGQPSVQPPN